MTYTPTLLRRSRLGELLVAEGKLSREELDAALAYREERGLKLGQALVALHLVTQQDLAGALRSQGRVHCLHLTPGIVDPEIARLLPEAMARQFVALPVHRVAGRVTVAMEDPAEEYDVDAIAAALGEPVFAVHSDPERIRDAIERLHPGAEVARAAVEAPRFTLVRGPLPENDRGEAADLLVRAALREARRIGAESFHVESTARGAEMSFRVDGARTPTAVLPAEWAEACAAAALALAGGSSQSACAAGRLAQDDESLEVDVATLHGAHGRCARIALRSRPIALSIEHLPLEVEERASIQAWLAATGLLLVVGTARAGADALARELGARAAAAGRRVYRLGLGAELAVEVAENAGEQAETVVAVARGANGDVAADLRAIGDQAPDVVDAGAIRGAAAWTAAIEVARAGALVIARVEAQDAASAVAAVVRECGDAASAIEACVGAVALGETQTACRACVSESDRACCASCRGAGRAGSARIAEVLDFRGALRERFERDPSAAGLRAAARDLGLATFRDRECVRTAAPNSGTTHVRSKEPTDDGGPR